VNSRLKAGGKTLQWEGGRKDFGGRFKKKRVVHRKGGAMGPPHEQPIEVAGDSAANLRLERKRSERSD